MKSLLVHVCPFIQHFLIAVRAREAFIFSANFFVPPSLLQAISAHFSMEQSIRACLDGYKDHLRRLEGDLGQKDQEQEVVAEVLKQPTAKNKRLKEDLEKAKRQNTILLDYYNSSKGKMNSLRQELDRAKAALLPRSRSRPRRPAILFGQLYSSAKSAIHDLGT